MLELHHPPLLLVRIRHPLRAALSKCSVHKGPSFELYKGSGPERGYERHSHTVGAPKHTTAFDTQHRPRDEVLGLLGLRHEGEEVGMVLDLRMRAGGWSGSAENNAWSAWVGWEGVGTHRSGKLGAAEDVVVVGVRLVEDLVDKRVDEGH